MTSLYRCAGDVVFDKTSPAPGQICSVQLREYSETCNFLQYLSPLSPDRPYFFVQVSNLAEHSRITIGIAGPDISEDASPGSWNNSVGCHSDTGRCFTSHNDVANTDGEGFGIGDVFGVLVTYFGRNMSTVIFLKNNVPVATRFILLFIYDYQVLLEDFLLVKQYLPRPDGNGCHDLDVIGLVLFLRASSYASVYMSASTWDMR
ncbi:uncharacterized protein LOC121369676 [Gigantopelta aegis]|uniref:uncharacterized protein LOC121369676 n=1 Tax=Gigantopelta aegis TaxID=1735272 RepID=UPI001B88E5BF|nr:uncharacterized protein LOC121369676 [Gigantopelta aegis]